MRIMSFKPDHDGTIAALDVSAAELIYSYEAEKDSFVWRDNSDEKPLAASLSRRKLCQIFDY